MMAGAGRPHERRDAGPPSLAAWAESSCCRWSTSRWPSSIVGIIVRIIGVDPFHALELLVVGAIGSPEAIGYTLYYATNFIFTGLAVAVAFHAGLFNIGGEGQAYLGGLGCGLAILALDRYLPVWLMIPVGIVAAALFGAAWAAVPAWLQAWRGSHIVITTIMFNFVASALMVYLMVNVLIAPGSMTPQSRGFAPSAFLPVHDGRSTRSTCRIAAGARLLRRRLGVPVAHAVGLCAAHHGPQSRRPRSMPAPTCAA